MCVREVGLVDGMGEGCGLWGLTFCFLPAELVKSLSWTRLMSFISSKVRILSPISGKAFLPINLNTLSILERISRVGSSLVQLLLMSFLL